MRSTFTRASLNLMPGERHKYDVMLKTGDMEDEKVVNILQTWLQQSGYKIYTAHPNACEL